jgi:hypothetical protein
VPIVAYSLNPDQRRLRSRVAAHAQHAQGKTNTGPAQAAFLQRFLDQVDPDRVLSEEEREKRAAHARKQYFSQLALKSSVARGRAKALTAEAEAAEAEAAALELEATALDGADR